MGWGHMQNIGHEYRDVSLLPIKLCQPHIRKNKTSKLCEIKQKLCKLEKWNKWIVNKTET